MIWLIRLRGKKAHAFSSFANASLCGRERDTRVLMSARDDGNEFDDEKCVVCLKKLLTTEPRKVSYAQTSA